MDELLELEHAGWRSLCEGTGSEFYGAMMTPYALLILANGEVMSRDQAVAALADAPPWSSYSIDDASILTFNDDAAALVYTGTGRRAEGPDFVGAMTSVYVRTDGGWKLGLYQQTAVA